MHLKRNFIQSPKKLPFAVKDVTKNIFIPFLQKLPKEQEFAPCKHHHSPINL